MAGNKIYNKELPNYVYVRRGWYVFRQYLGRGKLGKDIRLCEVGTPYEELIELYNAIRSDSFPKLAIIGKENSESFSKTINQYASEIFYRTKTNARTRKIELHLTKKDIEKMLLSSNLRCSLTNLPLNLEKTKAWKNRPFAPSLDRIDSKKAYTLENCRIVCVAANIAMSEFGEGILFILSRAICSEWSSYHEAKANQTLAMVGIKNKRILDIVQDSKKNSLEN